MSHVNGVIYQCMLIAIDGDYHEQNSPVLKFVRPVLDCFLADTRATSQRSVALSVCATISICLMFQSLAVWQRCASANSGARKSWTAECASKKLTTWKTSLAIVNTIASLRAQVISWAQITKQTGVSNGTIPRACLAPLQTA